DRLGKDRGGADRLQLPPPWQGHRRPRPRRRASEGLRRLGLRRPRRPRAQHRQLLGRRPRADRRTPWPAPSPAHPRRRRRLRAGDAGDRPRHPDPALRRRLDRGGVAGARRYWWIWIATIPVALWALMRTLGIDGGFPL